MGIMGSNPIRGMDVCHRHSLLYCPVSVDALRRADLSSKECYRLSINGFETLDNRGDSQDSPTIPIPYTFLLH
jgi:hypothetical protein